MIGSSFVARMERCCLLLLCIAAMHRNAHAAADAASPYLQVALWNPIDAGKVKVGRVIEAKAAFDWSSSTCVLHKDAHLSGHVVAVQKTSKESPESHLALVIDEADCQGNRHSPMKMEIVEIIGANPDNSERLADALPRKGSLPTSPRVYERLESDDPIVVHPGEVHGIEGVTLRLGAGPQGSVLLTRDKKNLYLATDTIMILSPANLAPVEVELKRDQ
jgi:hypothetical protein